MGDFMKFNSLSKAGLITALIMSASVGCKSDPQTFYSTTTDRFTAHLSDNYQQASQLLQADYMFILDYSYSMSQNGGNTSKIQTLLNSMEFFTSELETKGIDYKIGVVKGTVHSNNEDQIASNFFSDVISRDTTGSLLSSILSQLSPAGLPLSENTNYLLEAAKRTAAAQSSQFLRNGSQAVYVFVSDSDDRSQTNSGISGSKTPESYADALIASKNHFSYVSARAIVAGVGENCALRNGYDIAGVRLAETARLADSQASSASCIYNTFTESLADLARNVTRPTTRFTLRGNPVASSVRVFENGAEVSRNRWTYSAATNEVIFQAQMEPAFNSQLEIIYDQLFTLKSKPKVETLSVSVNGTNLNSSQFSYVASENRIEFLNASKPSEGDDIRITYQAQ